MVDGHVREVEHVEHRVIITLCRLVILFPPLDIPAAYLLGRFLGNVNEVCRLYHAISLSRRVVERQGKIKGVAFRQDADAVVCEYINLAGEVDILRRTFAASRFWYGHFLSSSPTMRPLRAQVSISELYAKAGREAEGKVRGVVVDCAVGVHIHEIGGGARTRGTEPPKSGGTRWEELRKEVPPKTFVKSAECNRIAGNFNISEDYIMDKTIFEQMGGTYHQEGDYFLPDLPPPESIPVGVWGQRRRQYLKTQRRVIYTGLLLSGKLDGHLAEIDAQAEAMLFQLVNQLAEQEGITEQLKAENQMEWVQRMNNIRNRVEEIIYNDLIYI